MLPSQHMGDIERQPAFTDQPEDEVLDPHHFYAAYVFDRANEREHDIRALIDQAQALDYPLRYWWLSDAMDSQGSPDRLIVCVHHPPSSEKAGMDLYDALKEKEIAWDDLEAAVMDEYQYLGKPLESLGDFRLPYGNWLFPNAAREGGSSSRQDDVVYSITQGDIREKAQNYLGRELTEEELYIITAKFWKALDWLDWSQYLHEVIRMCQRAGWVEPNVDETNYEEDIS